MKCHNVELEELCLVLLIVYSTRCFVLWDLQLDTTNVRCVNDAVT